MSVLVWLWNGDKQEQSADKSGAQSWFCMNTASPLTFLVLLHHLEEMCPIISLEIQHVIQMHLERQPLGFLSAWHELAQC